MQIQIFFNHAIYQEVGRDLQKLWYYPSVCYDIVVYNYVQNGSKLSMVPNTKAEPILITEGSVKKSC